MKDQHEERAAILYEAAKETGVIEADGEFEGLSRSARESWIAFAKKLGETARPANEAPMGQRHDDGEDTSGSA